MTKILDSFNGNENMKKLKTAILGGSFNPIHKAHIDIAKYICNTFAYERIIFVPSFISPHKEEFDYIKPIDRFNMTKIAIENYPNFIIEDYELKQEAISYTINTIEHIYQKHGDIDGMLTLIIGSDLIADFDKWKKASEIASRVNIVVLSRTKDETIEHENIAKYNMKLFYIDYIDISSTMIRENMNNKAIIETMLDKNVYQYIKANNLYNN